MIFINIKNYHTIVEKIIFLYGIQQFECIANSNQIDRTKNTLNTIKTFQANLPNFKIPVSGKWEATNIWIGKKFKATLSIAVDEVIIGRANKAMNDMNDITKNILLAIFDILNLFKLKINISEGITHKRILINEPLDDKFAFKYPIASISNLEIINSSIK